MKRIPLNYAVHNWVRNPINKQQYTCSKCKIVGIRIKDTSDLLVPIMTRDSLIVKCKKVMIRTKFKNNG